MILKTTLRVHDLQRIKVGGEKDTFQSMFLNGEKSPELRLKLFSTFAFSDERQTNINRRSLIPTRDHNNLYLLMCLPADHFLTSEPRNPSINVSELHMRLSDGRILSSKNCEMFGRGRGKNFAIVRGITDRIKGTPLQLQQ